MNFCRGVTALLMGSFVVFVVLAVYSVAVLGGLRRLARICVIVIAVQVLLVVCYGEEAQVEHVGQCGHVLGQCS